MNELEKIHDFDVEFEEGKKYEEDKVLDIIKKTGYVLTHRQLGDDKSTLSDYDINIPEINNTMECKLDKAGLTTNNVCIEVGQDGRPSGLLLTKAGFWLQSTGDHEYLAKSDAIKKLIKEKYSDVLNALIDGTGTNGNLSRIQFQSRFPKEQKGYIKYMDWYLIPKELFKTICLEDKPSGELTYDGLI